MPALNVLARLSELVYLPDAGGSVLVQENSPWTVFRTSIQLGIGLGTGYFGAAYLNRASREIVFAHRGMQLSEGEDVRAVLESNVGRAPRQYADAVGFYGQVVNRAREQGFGTFTRFQTGHSLGGGLANLMGATTAERTVGFNAIGVRSALAELGLDPNAAYPHISNVSALYDPARLVGEPIGTQRDVAVSSIPFVPDRFEPLVVFGFAVLLKFPLLRLATPTAYGYSQHSIRNMVKTLSGLGATELRDLVPGLELLPDGQSLTGPWTPEWSDLTRAIEASTGLRAALEREQFNDALDLTGSQLRREQTVALEHPVAYFGSSGPDFMAGANGDDLLRGGASADVLFGDDGADRLFGNAGDDFLIGGAGRDTYVFASGDGADTVIDAEGAAALVRSGAKLALGVKVSEGVWRDPHAAAGATYARAGTDLRITFADNASDSITLKDFDFAKAAHEGYLGIRLLDAPSAPTAELRTFLGDKQDYDGDASEPGVQTQTDAFGNTVRADGQDGRPDLELADRADLFYGSGADEVEKFLTAGGDDAVNADGPLSGASAAGGRDLVETGAGRDVVAAGAGDDWVEGGAEGDILTGNAGNDVLFADTSDGQTLTIEGAIAAGEAGIQAPGSGDILSGDAGDDVLLGSAGADLFLGGEGAEVIVGGAGDDTVYGDDALTSATLDWTVARTRTDAAGVATFSVALTNVASAGADAAGALDVIYGGAGADWIFAGAGHDHADGGVGDDVLQGEAGNDALSGGDGDDFLGGDSASSVAAGLAGDDFLDGGEGADELVGEAGNDILYGGSGADVLSGGSGEDMLHGGAGTDVLAGGAGKDTYVFERGDGVEVVQDAPVGADDPEASVLVLGPGIAPGDVKFRVASLMVDLGGGDAVHFEGFEPNDALATPVLDFIQFAEGEVMTYADILDRGFEAAGTEGDDEIEGTNLKERMDAAGGDDLVRSFGGRDTLLGGAGADRLQGGMGDDTLDGGTGADVLSGDEGADSLSGGAGDDLLDGGPGDDYLAGGEGADRYVLYGGMGSDRASDGEAGETNVITLVPGVSLASLRFARSGEDLQVGLRGLADTLTIEGYYARLQAWTIRDAEGGELALDEALSLPDPAGSHIERLWEEARLGQLALAGGAAHFVGWKHLGGGLFEGIEDRAWLSHTEQRTTETFRSVSTGQVLASNTTQQIEDTVLEFGTLGSSRLNWDLHRLETERIESDEALIFGPGNWLPRIDTPGAAVVTLAKEQPRHKERQSVWSNSGGVVSYDTGTQIVLANVTYDYELRSWNQFARVTEVNEPLAVSWSHAKNEIVGAQALVDLTRRENRHLNVVEIIGGRSANSIDATSGGAGIYGLLTLVDAGAGDDTITGSGFLYGNAGEDAITGTGTLAGGDGYDALAGTGRFVFTAEEIGIDTLAATEVRSAAYLDWYYGNLGIADWRESYTHGGQYRLDLEGRGNYYNSFEEADAVRQRYGFGAIVPIKPLPGAAPLVRRDDTQAIEELIAAGVMPRDTVEFGPGVTLADLTLDMHVDGTRALATAEAPWLAGGTLSVRWGDAGFDTAVPDANYGFTGSDLLADQQGNEYEPPALSYRLGEGIEQFRFADGSTYTLEEVLRQATIVEVLEPYRFVVGSGNQTIGRNYKAVVFEDGIRAFEVAITRDGVDLLLTRGSDQLRIQDWYSNPTLMPITRLEFAQDAEIGAGALTQAGLEVSGTDGDDVLQGLDGFADRLLGNAGNDALVGGGGDDSLLGFSGNDVLAGGPGDDALDGGDGVDAFILEPGGGHDRAENLFGGVNGEDVIRAAPGLASDDVLVSRDYVGLSVWVRGSTDRIEVPRWFSGPERRLAGMEFADGTFLTAAQMEARIEPAPGTHEDDVIFGSEGADSIDSLGGDDLVIGNEGDDSVAGGSGDDFLEGGAGVDILHGGPGSDALEDWEGANLFDAGPGDDFIYHEGNSFIAGGAGNDEVQTWGPNAVIAFNAGDGADTIYAASSLTLSLGGGIQPSDIALSQEGDDVVLSIGASDSVRLTRAFEVEPQAWPAIRLQLFGSVHAFDFNAVIADFQAARAADPGLRFFPIGQSLTAHRTGFSEAEALGGALAWQYATTGSLDALTDVQKRAVLGDPDFGRAALPIALETANHAPLVATPIADQAAEEDAGFSFTVPADTFSDPDVGDALSLSVSLADGSALPAWLAFDAGTGSFSGTPLQADVGSLDVRVTATDAGGLSTSDDFTLTVANVNDAPVLARPIADQSATEDTLFSFAVPADSVADEDLGDAIAWFAARADGGALPAWLTFDAANRSFSGTPANADVGAVQITVTASDAGGLSAADTFALTVANTNDAPVVANAPAEQLVVAGSPFAFALGSSTFADEDAGDALTYSAALASGGPLPAWLSFDSGTLSFSGTPAAGDIGAWPIAVTATDSAGAQAGAVFNLAVRAHEGATVGGDRGEDVLYGNAGAETLIGRGGNDYLAGFEGDDRLRGGQGNDVLQGGSGNDVLRAGLGRNVLDGGSGDDLIYGGRGAGLIIGGAGNDLIRAGRGRDVIVFNRGDGHDVVWSDGEGDNTLSLGGGIRYEDLRFRKSGKDLVLELGGSDSITFKHWYAGHGRTSLLNIQIVTEAMADFDDDAADPIAGARVNVFDARGLVQAFDAARAADPYLNSWALSDALNQFHLRGTDDAAIGGDLAYQYGLRGSLAGIGLSAAQEVIGAPGFGSEAQSLRPFGGLSEGFVKLA